MFPYIMLYSNLFLLLQCFQIYMGFNIQYVFKNPPDLETLYLQFNPEL